MEKYVFNKEFLSELKGKKRLSKRDILKVLGTQDYSSLTRWLDGVGIPPTEAMLKLCNEYNISPAQWFLCNGEPESMPIDENPFQITKMVAGEGVVSENELLRIQLAHAQEINEIERAARSREDAIRRECQINFDKERSRLMDLIERLNNEVLKNNKGYTGNSYRVGEQNAAEHDITVNED